MATKTRKTREKKSGDGKRKGAARIAVESVEVIVTGGHHPVPHHLATLDSERLSILRRRPTRF